MSAPTDPPPARGSLPPDPPPDVIVNPDELRGIRQLSLEEVGPLYPDYESQKTRESTDAVVDENRDVWSNKIEFLMACISTAVGLGNVWRFPFTAYQNGGGAFLFPYFLVLILIGKPIYFLELQVGQFSSRGAIGIWDMVPLLRGVGVAIIAIAFCTCVYYVAILGNCVLYMYFSFLDPLPWTKCDYKPTDEFVRDSVFRNIDCRGNVSGDGALITYPLKNGTTESRVVSHSELFFRFRAAKFKDNMDGGLGPPDLALSLSLLVVWLLIFGNMMLGTKTSGKGAYFTALFPYVVLFTLFFFVITKDGAMDGVMLYFEPDWAKVMTIQVWFKAISQAFFSLGVGYGPIHSYGSYNPFRQLPWSELAIVGFMDLMTSVVAGLVVFATLGVLGKETQTDVKDVVGNGGPGLAFVSYPELVILIGSYPVPQIFGFLFFFMLLTLGIGSGSGFIQAVMGALLDNFPALGAKKSIKIGTLAVLCAIAYLLGLMFCTRGGWYMIDFIEHYSSDFIVFVVVTIELAGISYIYGFKSFVQDLKFMFDIQHKGCGHVCLAFEIWGYIAPIILVIILAYTFATYTPLKVGFLGLSWPLPMEATVSGWLLFTSIIILIPAFAIKTIVTRRTRSWKKKFLASIRPNSKWGPKNFEEKIKWIEYRRKLNPTTAIYDLTIGRLIKVPRTPIQLTPVASTYSRAKIVAPGLQPSATSKKATGPDENQEAGGGEGVDKQTVEETK